MEFPHAQPTDFCYQKTSYYCQIIIYKSDTIAQSFWSANEHLNNAKNYNSNTRPTNLKKNFWYSFNAKH